MRGVVSILDAVVVVVAVDIAAVTRDIVAAGAADIDIGHDMI